MAAKKNNVEDTMWYIEVENGTSTHVYGMSHVYEGSDVETYVNSYAKSLGKKIRVYKLEHSFSVKPQ